MASLQFNNAHIIDPVANRVYFGSLRIEDGKITEPGPSDKIVECDEKYLAPGIVDMGVKVCEPGERHKESFKSAGRAAAAGGITTIVTRPDTTPAIDSPETLAFARQRAQDVCIVNTHIMAALTKGRAGSEMSEIGFLMDAGAVAFTDCDATARDPKVLSRAMAYVKQLGALLVAHPQNPDLSDGAAVTSGKFATLRGLPAVSPMAERMGLERDLALVEMTGVKYHADQVTTAGALPALSRAKSQGLDVTAGVGIHHLTLNELDVADYRTFFKVKPPLRSEDDRQAIVDALATGVIDILCSMHTPQDEESKRLPFEQAASGAIGLETFLPAALRLFHNAQIELPALFRAMSTHPAKRLSLDAGTLAPGAPADIILFDAHAPFVLDRFSLQSKSKNTPFDGQRMQGKVLATYVAGTKVYER